MVKLRKALMYFISFFSLSVMFSACYYLSYKNALRDFNESAVERNNELILSLRNNGYLQLDGQNDNTKELDNAKDSLSSVTKDNETTDSVTDPGIPVDMVEDKILPTTEYVLQIYNKQNDVMTEEKLPTPSYLIGLTRNEVIQYLKDYMQDLPLNEFQKGLISFELISFSKDNIVLRKTYDSDKIQYKYFLKEQNGYIVAYYGDQKTVFDYTGISVENLSDYERQKLKEGIFVKDLDELYAILENYSS
ncbi:MAG: BofC-C domain-containing protein [Lachnoclostridium sp.]|jgi:hypothetical protein